jgi:hypothetical protein
MMHTCRLRDGVGSMVPRARGGQWRCGLWEEVDVAGSRMEWG